MSPDALRAAAQRLAEDLRACRLVVEMYPCRRTTTWSGQLRRVAVEQNPDWYRRLCAEHLSSAHPRRSKVDTAIRRRETLRALDRLAAGAPVRWRYDQRLLPILRAHAAQGRVA